MNRTPNYRVWHKIEKRFVELRTINFEKQDISYDAYREANYEDISSFEDVVFQQWTGFVDRNGKYVYEGDFLGEKFEAIEFYDGKFIVNLKGARTFELEEFWEDGLKPEVIGNIFELPCNPDHNGECLVCDEPLDGCPFLSKEPEYHLSPKNNEWLKKKEKTQEELQKFVKHDRMWQKPLVSLTVDNSNLMKK